jgi:YHS domain-containing protein/thioredoxin-related protein
MSAPPSPRSRVPLSLRLLGLALPLSASLSSAPVRAQETSRIIWRSSFEVAREEAVARNRPVWAQFTGAWCPYCRLVERETFTQADVVARTLDDFVPVQVPSDDREDLVIAYQVVNLPAAVLLSPDGRILARHEGYLDTRGFRGLLETAQARFQASTADQPAREVALAGYDPVRLVREGGLATGKPELAVRVEGREYRFTRDRDRDAFLVAPERYLPCGDGHCLVSLVDDGKATPGDPRFGIYYRDHLYLCASEAARQKFAATPERYAGADLAEEGRCAHCRDRGGPRLPGLPQFSLFYRGRRYLFPDESHRTAFQTAPERYTR